MKAVSKWSGRGKTSFWPSDGKWRVTVDVYILTADCRRGVIVWFSSRSRTQGVICLSIYGCTNSVSRLEVSSGIDLRNLVQRFSTDYGLCM